MPRAFFVPEPLPWLDPRRAGTSVLDGEQCVLDLPDGRHFFVRANLELPTPERPEEPLVLTDWVSLRQTSTEDMERRWDDEDRAAAEPYFGYLSNELPGFPDSYLLRCLVHTSPPGFRPLLQLEPTGHPLAVAQREGITEHQVSGSSKAFMA